MQFVLQSVCFFTRLAPVSRPGVFFLCLELGHLCLVQVYIFYTRMEIGLVRLLRVYFLPAHCAFFLERAFLDCTCGSKNNSFKLQVYFGY